jgi:hypothetical protein
MKKIFKILTVFLLLIFASIIVIPIVFESKIIALVKKTANNNINATLDFDDADLSIWSSFPNTKVSLEKVSLINSAPFEGDTLFVAKTVDLKMPLLELFKKSNAINISSFTLDNATINIQIDQNGNANYNITKDNTTTEDSNTSNSFQLGLKSYKVTNSTIIYNDVQNSVLLKISDFNHAGNGNLSQDKTELETQSTALVSFEMDEISYLNDNNIQLDALLGINFKENTYRFLKNKALINQLPLVFDGFVKINDNNKEVDISFKTPSSDFRNFLALIPKVYSKNIDGVTTTGNFEVQGKFEGIVNEERIPKFNITIHSDNASFKYPSLSKTLKNIHINTEITNESGFSKDTYVLIDKLSFRIDDDVFNASAKLLDITENMKVKASLKGVVNLASLEKVYPAEALKGLKGILDVDASTNFDMRSIERKQYENTRTNGSLKLSNFEYSSAELSNPLKVSKAAVTFTPKTVNLNSFDAILGKTDFKSTGTIYNLLGFLFNKENVEGRFNLASNTFSINDFMAVTAEKEDEKSKKTSQNKVKIPSFLDCIIDAKATTVLYDNITLKNVSGRLLIKDQKVELQNMKSNVFDGALGFNGSVSTKDEVAKFKMDLDVNNFNIGQSFTSLDLFQALAPIAKAVDGKINSTISLSGNLNNDFTPELNSLTGLMIAQLLSSKISTEKTPLLQNLQQNLPFLDTKKLNLEKLKASLNFKDGKVTLKPFKLNYDDIEIDISGGHGFDKSLAYNAVLNVPAKYLGKEAEQLVARLNNDSQNIKVPINAIISGKFTNPSIKTDLKSAVANLTKQVAANQKEKLVNQGKDKITDALSGLLGGKAKDSIKVDSIKKDPTKEIAKDLLDGLFKRKKKKKDTVN